MAEGHLGPAPQPVSMRLSRHTSAGTRPRLGFSLGKFEIFFVQHFLALDHFRVRNDARDRTDFNALRPLEMADTFGAKLRIDLVKLDTLIDCVIRTLRLANIAVDALIGDQQGHR